MSKPRDLVDTVVGPTAFAGCSEDEQRVRRLLVTTWIGVSILTPFWGLIYVLYGEVAAGLIPLSYSAITVCSFLVFRWLGGWEWLRVSQLLQHLALPFALMWVLGGFGPSSAVLIWALLAPLSSLWAGRQREAYYVLAGFIALTVFSAVIDPYLSGTNELPSWLVTAFYAANFVTMTSVIFFLLAYFVRQQGDALAALRRNRELESAYLQQEVALRQSDKLATLGKLSAGLAHELNNPASAVQQATRDLSGMLEADGVEPGLDRLDLTSQEHAVVWSVASTLEEQIEHPRFMDPLDRVDAEEEVREILGQADVDRSWEIAPALVGLGLSASDVTELRESVRPDRLAAALGLLAQQFEQRRLIGSLEESTSRIIEMVRALKSYSHLDRAPRQLVDIHEGLESTLVMLQSRLKSGIEVDREYAADLPQIEAYGMELNQVWTNIIDNAIDATSGAGTIRIRTRPDEDGVVVEFEDDGPGIDPGLLGTIFDPFVTSKAPGAGTGLGLNISHHIVTQKHGGQIAASTEPGRTTFVVRLPANGLRRAEEHGPVSVED